MKSQIKHKILFLFFIISLSGCENWLEIMPPNGLVRDEFWETKEDVVTVLMGAYETFASMDENLFKYGEIRADMVIGDNNQPLSERMIQEGNVFADNPLANWHDFYKVINFCNEVIKNAPIVQEIDKTFTNILLQGYLAEAYFLRSLSYFYLVRIFKDVPYITEPYETDASNFYVTKTDGDIILNSLNVTLNEHRNFAPADRYIHIEENKGRASKAAFDALLADIALWQFNYDVCIEHIERIENSQRYALVPRNEFFNLFYPGNTTESIFEFQFDGAKGQSNNLFTLTNQNNLQYDPSQKSIEMFAFEFVSEKYRGENISIKKYASDNFIIWKYVGSRGDGVTVRSGTEQRSANWIVYRYSDILLMKAEALSQLERYGEATDYINMIRERADVTIYTNITSSPAEFEDLIMNERALELAFEGKRWFDLVRMGRRENFKRKDKLIEIIVQNVPSSQKRLMRLKLTDPLGWYLPVYNEEIERNRALVQNPYYNF
jgi:starch-binding outer membrane protein, SusD/RagB family